MTSLLPMLATAPEAQSSPGARNVLLDVDLTLIDLWPRSGWRFQPSPGLIARVIELLTQTRTFVFTGRPVTHVAVVQGLVSGAAGQPPGGLFALGEFGTCAFSLAANDVIIAPDLRDWVRDVRPGLMRLLHERLEGLEYVEQRGRTVTICLYSADPRDVDTARRISDVASEVAAEFADVVEMRTGELATDLLPPGASKHRPFLPPRPACSPFWAELWAGHYGGDPFEWEQTVLFEDSDVAFAEFVGQSGGLVCCPSNDDPPNHRMREVTARLGGFVAAQPVTAGLVECLERVMGPGR